MVQDKQDRAVAKTDEDASRDSALRRDAEDRLAERDGQVPADATAGWPAASVQAAPAGMASGQNQAVNVTVNNTMTAPPVQFVMGKTGHGLFARLLWFVFIGWWLSGLVIAVGYLFCATLILLPVGIWFLHRVPQAQTLKDRTREFQQEFKDGVWTVTEGTRQQHPLWLRAIYTLFVGLWVGLVWLGLAWLVSLPIITLPLSIWMIDRTPAVITLQKH